MIGAAVLRGEHWAIVAAVVVLVAMVAGWLVALVGEYRARDDITVLVRKEREREGGR